MKKLILLFDIIVTAVAANICLLVPNIKPFGVLVCIVTFVFLVVINIFPDLKSSSKLPTRLKLCERGSYLLITFLCSATVTLAIHIYAAVNSVFTGWKSFVLSAIIAVAVLDVIFWNGIIRVYCSSLQLGITMRVVGIICGWIPIANIIALCKIIRLSYGEVSFEREKIKLNESRKGMNICKTKYPVLLVHGVFFRDTTFPNYWGRIPDELIKNGAEVYYGKQDSAASVADSGKALAECIKKIVDETGCEKVNIIAHSKGGLDSRYAISAEGMAPYVASLTTICTPHRGCMFADYLLEKIPQSVQQSIADTYNAAMRKIGDSNPDFLSAVNDLTATNCKALNETLADADEVYYASVGSKLEKASGGSFPLNWSYRFAKLFDGANDGLVSETSFEWGQDFQMLLPKGKRGISHGDVIDLTRENIDGFDVREFYVQTVAKLKAKGF